MSIIQFLQAWFSSEDAVEWLKFENPDVEMILRRVDGQGLLLEVRPKRTQDVFQIGLAPEDTVRLARYMLAVAHVQGANINKGIAGVAE